MTKIMLFKRGLTAKELDMRYLNDVEQRNYVEKFKATGYLENPPLACMYNPETREQLIIHAEDRPILELRGFFATPTWVYHPKEGRKIVSADEAKQLFLNGWYDNPAKFPGNPLGVSKSKTTLAMPGKEIAA